jgi:PAS domain S-box-containing protein
MTALPVDFGNKGAGERVQWTFRVASAMVGAFLVSLILRSTGSYYTLLDGWGVDLFELSMGALCIARYLDKPWRSSSSAAKAFPLLLGAACISWALGDVATTIESLGGATPSTPSVANGFWFGFFPLCYISFTLVIRRGNSGSLVATALDGLIVGLGVASVSAAYVFDAVLRVAGGSALSAAINMAYPVGDLLLLALAVGGLAILPKGYRRFLVIAGIAVTANAFGDAFNLLQPASKTGYVANAVAWPVSLLMLAIATWAQPATAWTRPVTAQKVRTEKTAGFMLPALGALAGMAVLVSATVGHVDKAALAFAAATLLVAGIRLTLTVREARALNSARFRSLIDNAWDMIVVAEADLGVAYTTPSSERVLGYASEDLQGRTITELVHPDDTGALADHLHRLAAGSTETAAFESRMRHRNGGWRTIAWTATNLLEDPSVRGYVLNGGDVTEARQAAEDLAAARDEALTASKAKSEFLSTMSHEIRTPMNGVIGLTELLLQTKLDHDQHELASGVKVSAENLLVIINDILDFSKIEAGKLDIEEEAFSVANVADDVGRILAGVAHGKGVELLVDVQPSVPRTLLGDMVRIQQVLLNLTANGVKFTAEGEVVVRVSVLHQNAERVALRFEVIDTGLGIAVDDQKRLFRAFSQADGSTTRKYGGTGLGLAICRQLVELMAGKLGVISAPGEGSTFWFELSLRRAENKQSSAVNGDIRTLDGRRALVVDDNATNRMILRKQLTAWGIETVEAVDGVQALGLAAAAAEAGQMFDLGVVDLNMPGMDGIELAADLKADPATAEMTLFLLSSSGQRLGLAESHLRGFAGSLTKPVRPSELFDCLITSLNDVAPAREATKPQLIEPENAEVAGMILLVEDNKMNQLVGSKVLAKLGFGFDIANHGGEAVSAVQARNYDAILMDCQMPEMDGYQATAEIRRIESTTRHTPIIAMTAAAMDSDREACLAAGMDDYITKPVRLESVAAILERWVTRPAPDGAATARITSSSDDGLSDPLDPSQIELLRSLDDGDGTVLGEIIDQYLTQTAEGRGELIRVVGEGDTAALERAAHLLRGASANIGASALAAVCAEMETQSRLARLDVAAGLVEQFDTEFSRVRDALSLLVAKN